MSYRAKRRFGQNFLTDAHVVERILAALAPSPDDAVVEIGPGLGALTAPLLKHLERLRVIELDWDLAARLETRLGGAGGKLKIIREDALEVDFAALAGTERLRVIGNLPYNISTPLVFHLLDALPHIRDMHFMLQKEVVDRMAAEPGSKRYGRLSVMVQYACAVEPLFDVPPGAFRPPPKVTSSIVRLVPHESPPVQLTDRSALDTVVARAFGQRRKTLRNALSGLLDAEAIEAAGIDPGARAETLDLAAFARLADAVVDRRSFRACSAEPCDARPARGRKGPSDKRLG